MVKKMKYARTMFSGISKRAYMKVEKDFYDFLDDTHNEFIHTLVTNEQFTVLLVNLDRFTEFDRANNDPLTDQQVEYIDALNLIIASARENGLNELEIECE